MATTQNTISMIMGALKLLNLLSFGRLSFIAVSLGGLHNGQCSAAAKGSQDNMATKSLRSWAPKAVGCNTSFGGGCGTFTLTTASFAAVSNSLHR
jgi:hypothetical protein